MKRLFFIIIGLGLLAVTHLIAFGTGMVISSQGGYVQKDATGYEVWDAVNAYRREQNLPEFRLSQTLCNNISTRWQQVIDDKSHARYDTFVESQIATKRWPDTIGVSELYSSGFTAEEVVNNWKSSPSHNIALIDPDFNVGCSYAAWGMALLFLSADLE